jgi:hypothetical protein
MLTIQIADEQLAQRLQQIAEQEQRPIVDVLKAMADQYSPQIHSGSVDLKNSDAWRRVRGKAYAKARHYWQSVGDASKAALTDQELDDQFGRFDEDGIPRLKSEMTSLEPPVGSLAYAAKVIREIGGIHSEKSLDADKADDILNDEFADYLLKRLSDEDATE